MRIAQVAALWSSIPPLTYGGIELLVSLLTEELTHRGHDVTLFASGDSRTSAHLRAVIGVNAMEAMTRCDMYDYEYYAAAAMTQVLREAGRFDVIHSHLGASKIPFSVLSDTPIVHTLHTAMTVDDQWVLREYPSVPVVAISRSQIAVLDEDSRSRIPVVHNACDFEAYELASPPGDYLVFLGRMGRHKNPLDAIRIAKAVGLPLILAGKPQTADEERYFTEEVLPLIDGSQIQYVGPVNLAQKRDLLKRATAFLFPTSWPEPCGVAPLEALASGLPVLAYDNGAVPEIIEYGVTGYYATSFEALVSLVPQALGLDRATIRERASRRFSHRRLVDDYEAVYASLTMGRERSAGKVVVRE